MKYRTLLLAFVALFIASGSALAGGHVRFGVFVGMPYYQPYYYQPYYPPQVVVVPAQPPVYIQQMAPAPTQSQGGDWYYCSSSRAYYPYVKECPEAWQRVPAQPLSR
jgi:hypothetical protein